MGHENFRVAAVRRRGQQVHENGKQFQNQIHAGERCQAALDKYGHHSTMRVRRRCGEAAQQRARPTGAKIARTHGGSDPLRAQSANVHKSTVTSGEV